MCVDTNSNCECECAPIVHGMIDGNAYHSSLNTWPVPMKYVCIENDENGDRSINGIDNAEVKTTLSKAGDGNALQDLETDKLGNVLVELNSRMYDRIKNVNRSLDDIKIYFGNKDIPSIVVVPTMDMEFAHIHGYSGKCIYQENRKLGRVFYEKYEQKDPIYLDEDSAQMFQSWLWHILDMEAVVTSNAPRFLPLFSYDPRRYRLPNQESPGDDDCNAWNEPFAHIIGHTDSAIYAKKVWLGFCMNPSLGFRPLDELCEHLPAFYQECVNRGVPILAHCAPGGITAHEAEYYPDNLDERISKSEERHKMIRRDDVPDALCSSMYYSEEPVIDDRKCERLNYFYMNNGHPRNWIPVLKYFPGLRLCLSGFGGNSEWHRAQWPSEGGSSLAWPTREWIRCIIKLTAKYKNVYADLSGLNIYDPKIRNGLSRMLELIQDDENGNFKHLKHKLIFGSGWYLAHLANVSKDNGKDIKHSYSNYCREFKDLFDEADKIGKKGELWERVSLVNPWNFYVQSEKKFKDILSALQNDNSGKNSRVSDLSPEFQDCCRRISVKNSCDGLWNALELDDSYMDLIPRKPRKRLPVNTQCNIYKMLTKEHYDEMHRLLNNLNDDDVGGLLKSLWEKHEKDKLKVFKTKDDNPRCGPGLDAKNVAIGIYINTVKGAGDIYTEINGENHRVLKPYQTIFHEFFHNIDMGLTKDNVMYSRAHNYNKEALRKKLSVEIRKVVGKPNRMVDKNLNRTFMNKLLHDPPVSELSEISYVVDTICVAALTVDGAHLVRNGWLRNYIGRKNIELQNPRIALSAEFFANMAAAAITNHDAFYKMQEYFPESYDIFIEILEYMNK